MRKASALALVVGAITVALAACSSSQDSPDPDASTSQQAVEVTAESSDPAVAEGTSLTILPTPPPELLPIGIGEQISIRNAENVVVATVTINEISSDVICDAQPYNGRFLAVTIGATLRPEWDAIALGGYRITSNNFGARVGESIAPNASGMTYMCNSDMEKSLKPGESWAGVIAVDVHEQADALTFRPWAESEAAWVIPIP